MEERLAALTFGKALMIGVALAASYYFFIYDDGSNLEANLAAVKKELATREMEIEAINIAVKDAERFQITMENLGQEMDRILKAIPEKLSSVDVMKIVSNEAKGVGAEINRLNSIATNYGFSSKKDEKPFYEQIAVDVELTGSYNQIMLFLSNLTRIDKIIITNKARFAVAGDEKSRQLNPIIKFSGTLFAYKYIPETTDPAATKGGGM